MDYNNLELCYISNNYVDYLRNIDNKVQDNKVDDRTRPYVGVVLKLDGIDYFAPLSSKIRKSNPFTILIPNRLTKVQEKQNIVTKEFQPYIGIIKLNTMIPVYDEVIEKIDLNTIPADKSDQDYRNLLMKDFLFCSENKESILKKTKKAYKIYEDKKPYMEELIKACCNFPLLVDGMKKYREVQLNTSTTKPKSPTNVAIDEQNNTFEEVAVTKVL